MASENLTMELWDIIRKNNQEEIPYNDFEKDLKVKLNLPKDEVDRGILKMIFQAKVNPNIIGENKGGIFSISQGFISVVKSIIKFENQYIPGKEEYFAREMGERIIDDISVLAFVGLEKNVIDRMLDNFNNLTSKDVMVLAGQFYKMNDEEKENFLKGQKQRVQASKSEVKSKKAKKTLEKLEENLEEIIKTHNEVKSGTVSDSKRESYRKAIQSSKEFKKYYFTITGNHIDEKNELNDEDLNIWLSYGNMAIEESREIEVFLDKVSEVGNLENFIKLLLENPELGERFLDLIEKGALNREYDLNAVMGLDEETIARIDDAIMNMQAYQEENDGTIDIPTSKEMLEKGTSIFATEIEDRENVKTQETKSKNSFIQQNPIFYLKRWFKKLQGLEVISQEQILTQNVCNVTLGNKFNILYSDITNIEMSSKEGQDYWAAIVPLKNEYSSRVVVEYKKGSRESGEDVNDDETTRMEEEVFGSIFDMFDIESGDNESVLEQSETQIEETIQKQQEIEEKTREEGSEDVGILKKVQKKEELYKSGLGTDDIDYAKITDQEFESAQTVEVEHMKVDPNVVLFKEGFPNTIAIDGNNKMIESIISDSTDADDSSNSGDGSKKTLGTGDFTLLVSSVRSGSIMDAQQELLTLTGLEKNQDKGKEDIEEDTQIQE